jgi:UrcA family protein
MIFPVALALMLPAPAIATDDGAPSVTVRYSDLDLRTEAGVHKLHLRVHDAAVQVCAASGFYKDGFVWSNEARKCQRDADAAAEPRLDLAVARARGVQVASADTGEFTVGRGGGR